VERLCHKGAEVEIKKRKNKTSAMERAMRASRTKKKEAGQEY